MRRLAAIGRLLCALALVSCALVLLSLVPHAPVHQVRAAGSFVQDGFTNCGGSVNTCSDTLSGVTAGNALIVVTLNVATTVDSAVCSDNKGDVFHNYSGEANSGTGRMVSICVAFNVAGGSTTATCSTFSGTAYASTACYIAEVSGVYAVDSTAYATANSVTSISYTTTTSLSGDLLFAVMQGGSGTITPGSGWTSHAAANAMFQVAGAAGGYTTNWSMTSSSTLASASIALKAGSNPTIGTSSAPVVNPVIQGTLNNTGSCTFSSNVTSGDPLLAGVSVNTGATLTGVSDSLSSTWTAVDSNSTQAHSKVWVASAASSGADTITFTATGTVTSVFTACAELSSSVVTTTVDAHLNSSYEGEPWILTSPSLTTTVNGDYLFMFTGSTNGTVTCWTQAPAVYISGRNCTLGLGNVLGAAAPAVSTFYPNQNGNGGNLILLALKPASSITLITSLLPTASTSHSYSYCLYAVQGAGSYTWSVSSGALPTGLSINSSTGCITGTPTGGTTTPTFQVTDGTNTTTKALTLTVNSSASTPSFVQAVLDQLGSTLAFTSVSVNDVLWVAAQNQVSGGGGAVATPTDSIGTVFHLVGVVSGVQTSAINEPTSTWVWAGQATGSGADTVTFVGGLFVPSGLQLRGVQPFYDATTFTAGSQTTANQTFTSTSATTPVPNSMSAGVVTVNPGSPSSITAQSPYTDAGSLLLDNHIVDIGYDVVASVGSTAFSSAIVGGSTSAAWNMAMTNLRPSTSGAVSTNHRRAWVIER